MRSVQHSSGVDPPAALLRGRALTSLTRDIHCRECLAAATPEQLLARPRSKAARGTTAELCRTERMMVFTRKKPGTESFWHDQKEDLVAGIRDTRGKVLSAFERSL